MDDMAMEVQNGEQQNEGLLSWKNAGIFGAGVLTGAAGYWAGSKLVDHFCGSSAEEVTAAANKAALENVTAQ